MARIAADGAETIARVEQHVTLAPTTEGDLAARYDVEATVAAIADGGFRNVCE